MTPRLNTRWPAPVFALALILTLLAQSISAPRALAQNADAATLLRQTAQTMAGLKSFHFALTTPQGKTLFMKNFELSGVEGDVQRPDRFQASITVKAAIISLTLKVIGVGTTLWVTDPTSQNQAFRQVPLGDAADAALPDLLNPDRLLLSAVSLVQQPRIAGQDEIGGAKVTRIEGTFDPGQSQPGTPVPGIATGKPLPVKIWIDESHRVVRMELDGPLLQTEASDVVRQLDLSKFDQQVDIQPPATAPS